jgi:hypothetical protein
MTLRGVATGGGGGGSGPPLPTFLQDPFCNSLKTEEKVGAGRNLLFSFYDIKYVKSLAYQIIIKRV